MTVNPEMRARNEALVQLDKLFSEKAGFCEGSYCLYVVSGQVKAERVRQDMKMRDYFATVAAAEFINGIGGDRWDRIIKEAAERIKLQWQVRQ
jgi:hypothetical protein